MTVAFVILRALPAACPVQISAHQYAVPVASAVRPPAVDVVPYNMIAVLRHLQMRFPPRPDKGAAGQWDAENPARLSGEVASSR